MTSTHVLVIRCFSQQRTKFRERIQYIKKRGFFARIALRPSRGVIYLISASFTRTPGRFVCGVLSQTTAQR